MKQAIDTVFSRPFAVDRLAAAGEARVIVRAEGEAALTAIATRLRIPAVTSLAVEWTLRPGTMGRIDADGVLDAVVVQECVVTLEPLAATVAEPFSVLFVPAEDGRDDAEEQELGDDDLEAPDVIPFSGRSIDLGEAAVEQLALALDPFPRSPGAALPAEEGAAAADGPGRANSPFAVLANRRARPDRDNG